MCVCGREGGWGWEGWGATAEVRVLPGVGTIQPHWVSLGQASFVFTFIPALVSHSFVFTFIPALVSHSFVFTFFPGLVSQFLSVISITALVSHSFVFTSTPGLVSHSFVFTSTSALVSHSFFFTSTPALVSHSFVRHFCTCFGFTFVCPLFLYLVFLSASFCFLLSTPSLATNVPVYVENPLPVLGSVHCVCKNADAEINNADIVLRCRRCA